MQLMPQLLDYARGNRQFMVRVVKFLASAGIRQFLDIGTGFPASPNVHEVAQAVAPGCARGVCRQQPYGGLACSLHHLENEDNPADVVARYLPAFVPGSYLVV